MNKLYIVFFIILFILIYLLKNNINHFNNINTNINYIIINIDKIKNNDGDDYFQKSSPDGYCFHGLSLYNINEINEAKKYFKILKNMNFHFNLPKNKELNHGYNGDDIIVYTYVWCFILSNKFNKSISSNLYNKLNSISTFENGYLKYSKNYSKLYSVPNIIPMFLYIDLIYNNKITNKFSKYCKLIIKDFDYKEKNWYYKKYINNKWVNQQLEDSMHLSMIYYFIFKILEYSKNNSIKLEKIFNKLKNINSNIENKIINYSIEIKNNTFPNKKYSSIGWHYPWILFVLSKTNKNNLYNYFYLECLKENGIKHKNYRTRAMTSFLLSEIYKDKNKTIENFSNKDKMLLLNVTIYKNKIIYKDVKNIL